MNNRIIPTAAIGAVLSLCAVLGVATPAGAVNASPAPRATPTVTDSASPVDYFVVPHEDDEFELWSRVENSDGFKVFIVMSRGEQTAFCTGYSVGIQTGLERVPAPVPGPQFSAACEDARLSSWRNFFGQMSVTDPSIPGEFTDLGHTRQFPTSGVPICRNDATTCATTDRSAQVWNDNAGRGVLIAFNLGEGDQTSAEVDWAIDTVLANKAEFGIDPARATRGMIGGYWNGSYPGCAVYNNVDHRAVHVALRNNRYPVPYQGAATCASDPDGNSNSQVSEASMNAAWEVAPGGLRIGAHVSNYGWLHESYYPLSRTDQSALFMGAQSFWIIHNVTAENDSPASCD